MKARKETTPMKRDRSLYPDPLTTEYVRKHADDSSYILIRWWQSLWYILLCAALLIGFVYRWDILLCLINFALAAWYLAIILFRSIITVLSLRGRGIIRSSADQLAAINEDELPIFTVLVPLYKESNIAGRIVHQLHNLDYPHHKLDIKFLLEEDDHATLDAVRDAELTDSYEIIIIPDSQPKTKPKACNHGLASARGEFCVIFDAEDRPEPDQLKKVVLGFQQQPADIACLQARLNYFNPTQNLLTRWFTIEYSTTFDLYLPGLQCAKVPMPLGGTSNHFRTNILKELDGWDPFNVTEDCELGVRLYRAGFRTMMLDSTTWEEANSNLWNWVRQRSRWVKGFFQTHLAHMRNPFRTFQELGARGFVGFLLCVGGSSFMMVLNVIYWVVGGIYLTAVSKAMLNGYGFWEIIKGPRAWIPDSIAWPMVYAGPKEDPLWSTLSIIFFVITCVLLFSNLLFVLMHVLACLKRRFYHLIPFALLMPFYWILISFGAWKGFIQLFTNPFYWEKTIHGLDKTENP